MTRVKAIITTTAMVLLAAGTAMLSSGCASSAKAAPTNLRAGIPPGAQLSTQGTAPSFRATEAGRIWVYDASDNHRLGIYSMRPDQTFLLEPKSGRATLDGNEVKIDDVKNGHVFHIYFESDASRATSSSSSSAAEGSSRVTVYKEDPEATRKANQSK